MRGSLGFALGFVCCLLLLLFCGCGGGGGGGDERDGHAGAGSGDNDPGGDTKPPVGGNAVTPWPGTDLPVAHWYAAPDGRTDAAGTAQDPLALETLLGSAGPVRSGQRVVLLNGTYRGRFTCSVAGTAAAPIHFAAAPGARVILDGHAPDIAMGDAPVLSIGAQCRWVTFQGLEITHGSDERHAMVDGVEIFGADTKLINSVIHNTSQGIGFWRTAENGELYGNIIYNNGFEGATRGHGHAIYTQNQHGTKRIIGNILFFGYGYGIHAYTEGGYLQGFDILDNVWFRSGASRPGSSTGGTSDGCLVGGLQPVVRTRLEGNHSWAPTAAGRSLRLGWGGSVANEDITLIDNYIVGTIHVQGSWSTADSSVQGNHFFSSTNHIDAYQFPENTFADQLPTGLNVVVQTNAYDDARADLIIYNWDTLALVPVDLSILLAAGAAYRIYSVFDLWGTPVAEGVYTGSDISIPMGTKAPPQPRGDAQGITGADDPGRIFGVFILRTDRPFGS